MENEQAEYEEGNNQEEKEEMTMQMPKSPPRQKRMAGLQEIIITEYL
jgi:hypothetical protein